ADHPDPPWPRAPEHDGDLPQDRHPGAASRDPAQAPARAHGPVSTDEVLALAAEKLAKGGSAPLTIKAVVETARAVLRGTTKPVEEIAPSDIRSYLAWLNARGVAPATFTAYAMRLKMFFGCLLDAGVVTSDPTIGFKVVRPRPTPQLLLSRR